MKHSTGLAIDLLLQCSKPQYIKWVDWVKSKDYQFSANNRVAEIIIELHKEILSRGQLLSFDFILDTISIALSGSGDFMFVFHEDKRFDAQDYPHFPGKLIFNFYSFNFQKNSLERFDHPDDVHDKVDTLLKAGFRRRVVQSKYTILTSENCSISEQNFDLLGMLISSQYFTCGGFGNFSENMARRKISEALHESTIVNIEDSISKIAGEYGAFVCIGDVIDSKKQPKFYFKGFDLEATLLTNEKFNNDLRKTVSQSTSRFGSIDEGHYLIYSVARHFYSAPESVGDSFVINKPTNGLSLSRVPSRITEKLEPANRLKFLTSGEKKPYLFRSHLVKTVVIFSPEHPISLDIEKHLDLAFGTFFLQTLISDREDAIARFQSSIIGYENEIISDPIADLPSLSKLIKEGVSELLRNVYPVSGANHIAYFAIDSNQEKLEQWVSVGDKDKSEFFDKKNSIPINEEGSILAFCAKHTVIADSARARHRTPKIYRISGEFLGYKVGETPTDLPPWAKSTFCIPVLNGRVCHGILFFASTSTMGLSADLNYYEIVAKMLGNFCRRVTLTNDNSWLSRLSFLHSARHDLKNIVAPIRAVDPQVADRLESIIKRYSGVTPTSESNTIQSMTDIISECLSGSSANVNIHLKDGNPTIPENLSGITYQAFYALVENAKKYEGNLPGNISIEEKRDEFCDGRFVDVVYTSSSFTNDKTTERLFVSPLPDQSNSSFRFGLFLTACQIRMVGGEASSMNLLANPAGEYPFRIRFRLPLDT